MKKIVSLGLVASSLIVAGACSDDDDKTTRDDMSNAGSGMTTAGTGSGGTGTGGTGMTGDAGTGGDTTVPTLNYGAALSIADSTVTGPAGTVAIGGNIFAATNGEKDVGEEGTDASSWIETFTATGDEICMKGEIKEVPTAGDYGTHWGVQAGMNLNVPALAAAAAAATPDAGAADADAGVAADAGAAADPGAGLSATPEAWDAGDVIGFSFTVEGTVPAAMRFLGTPSAPDLSADPTIAAGDLNYCSNVSVFDGENNDVLFSDIVDRCWGETARAPFAPPLISVAWQIPSDVGAANNYPFDFCIKNIRAIVD